MLEIDMKAMEKAIIRDNPLMTEGEAVKIAQRISLETDKRLEGNVREWIEGKPLSDIWIGKYCIGAIMSIRHDHDFVGALMAMNLYLKDEAGGFSLIWRPKL